LKQFISDPVGYDIPSLYAVFEAVIVENIGDRQDQKQGRQKHIGKNKMDHGETEGQKKEKDS